MKSLLRHIGDACEYVSKPGARINAVQLCGLDQAVHGGGAFPALVGACEKPSLPAKCRTAQHALGSVIRKADVNRPGFVGGSNFQIGWSRYEQDDEQILS